MLLLLQHINVIAQYIRIHSLQVPIRVVLHLERENDYASRVRLLCSLLLLHSPSMKAPKRMLSGTVRSMLVCPGLQNGCEQSVS